MTADGEIFYNIKMENFRLSGSRYLLTYPQSNNLLMEDIRNHLLRCGDVKYLIVCEERHQSGDLHHHAFVLFHRCLSRRRNIFNMENYNCNVEIVGRKKSDIKNAINYCKKKESTYVMESNQKLKKR